MKLPLILVLLALTACSSAQSQTALKIGPGDLLSIDVYDVMELKQEIRVSDTGDAELALIGQLHLADLTPADAAHRIAAELSARALVPSAQVQVLIREYATQGVAVSGEVRKPGVYPVLAPRPLANLISEAGGFTELASPRLLIKRHNGAEESVSLPRNQGGSNVFVYPGDAVLVQRTGLTYLVGEVARSGGYTMQNEGQLSVAQLVALGGGLTPTAKAKRARLVRKTATGREELTIDVVEILRGRAPDVPLQPDDILFIPNSLWKTASTRLQNIMQMTAGAAIYTSLN